MKVITINMGKGRTGSRWQRRMFMRHASANGSSLRSIRYDGHPVI